MSAATIDPGAKPGFGKTAWRIRTRSLASGPFIALLTAVLAISPYIGIPAWTPPLATLVLLSAVSLVGLNLVFGIGGMLVLGQAVFSGLSGYGAGMCQSAGVPFVAAVLLGIFASIAIARIFAVIFVRLPGFYLGVGTLGVASVGEGLVRAYPSLTGGASGLVLTMPLSLNDDGWYAVALIGIALSLIVCRVILDPATVRALRLVRTDELAAAVAGIDVVRLKIRLFTLGAAFSAVSGVLKAYYAGVATPNSIGVDASLEQLANVIIGGAGSLTGPVVGSFVTNWFFQLAGAAQQYELLAYGTAIFLIVLFLPRGLVGIINRLMGREPKPTCSATVLEAGPDEAAPVPQDGIQDREELAVANISKHFGALVAVNDIDLRVSPGEVVALLGPNGAGKSTFFNIISGVDAPTTGSIRVGERAIEKMPLHRRAVWFGRSFQVPRLALDMTVLENVVVRLDQLAPRTNRVRREGEALAHLECLGLAALADSKVADVGVGTHKLIDVARASVGRPPVLLLDEPAVGLSPEERQLLVSILLTLRDAGTAILVVEHDMGFIKSIADTICVMDSGRCIAKGVPQSVFEDPRVQDAYLGVLA